MGSVRVLYSTDIITIFCSLVSNDLSTKIKLSVEHLHGHLYLRDNELYSYAPFTVHNIV